MNTISPNEDMYSDFFEVGSKSDEKSFNNFANSALDTNRFLNIPSEIKDDVSASSNVGLRGRSTDSSARPLSYYVGLSNKLDKVSWIANKYKKYSLAQKKVMQDYILSEDEADFHWIEYLSNGGNENNTEGFLTYMKNESGNLNSVRDQIINEQNVLQDAGTVDVSDVNYAKEDNDKDLTPLIYVGLGVIALVGVTVIVLRK